MVARLPKWAQSLIVMIIPVILVVGAVAAIGLKIRPAAKPLGVTNPAAVDTIESVDLGDPIQRRLYDAGWRLIEPKITVRAGDTAQLAAWWWKFSPDLQAQPADMFVADGRIIGMDVNGYGASMVCLVPARASQDPSALARQYATSELHLQNRRQGDSIRAYPYVFPDYATGQEGVEYTCY